MFFLQKCVDYSHHIYVSFYCCRCLRSSSFHSLISCWLVSSAAMYHGPQAHREFISRLSCENHKSFLRSVTTLFNPRGFSRFYSVVEHKGPLYLSVPHQHSSEHSGHTGLDPKWKLTKFSLVTNSELLVYILARCIYINTIYCTKYTRTEGGIIVLVFILSHYTVGLHLLLTDFTLFDCM